MCPCHSRTRTAFVLIAVLTAGLILELHRQTTWSRINTDPSDVSTRQVARDRHLATYNRTDPDEGAGQADDVPPSGSSIQKRMNVLFIIVDDLRPQLGAYFDPEHPDYFSKLRIRTPHLDRLASEGAVFSRLYVQYSLCGPSRASMLTSRRPDVTRVYTNRVYWRDVGGNFTTLPQYFKDNGYVTVGLGKVFHPAASSNDDDPPSWTEPYYHPRNYDRRHLPRNSSRSWAMATEDDMEVNPLRDLSTTEMAKSTLEGLARRTREGRQPFFLAVGFHKPHMNTVCPERYFRLYPLEDEEDFLPNRSWQRPLVRPTVHIGGIEVANGSRVLESNALRGLRRAYFACISFVDALVGELLQRIDDLGLADDTVVSFVADHGFHLGENRHWGKVTTHDMANRVPFIIRVPASGEAGQNIPALAEAVDVFPTVVEAAGLPAVPPCPPSPRDVQLCTQGVSLMPLIKGERRSVKEAAYSQICLHSGMRYAIRTKDFRLVDRAIVNSIPSSAGKRRQTVTWSPTTNETEFYVHQQDIFEQFNEADDPKYTDIVSELRERLHRFVEDNL